MDLTQLDRPVAINRIERSLMEDHVSTLRPKQPVTVLPTTTVGETIQLLLDNDIGAFDKLDSATLVPCKRFRGGKKARRRCKERAICLPVIHHRGQCLNCC